MPSGNTYIIGDIQGCYEGLQNVLKKAKFDPNIDKLYAVGDLVARGENSLETLRFLQGLGKQFSCVLGNHDLHLLAVVNNIRKAKKSDKLTSLLNAPDINEIVEWLRQFPLAQKVAPDTVIVHAGLYPQWSLDSLISHSEEVSNKLRSDNYAAFLKQMYGNTPSRWSDSLKESERLRFIVNACTRMRFVYDDMSLDFDNKSHPSTIEPNKTAVLRPWFEHTNVSLQKGERIVFGHWAALEGQTTSKQFIGLDTGYVWGQSMTMLNLKTGERISVSA